MDAISHHTFFFFIFLFFFFSSRRRHTRWPRDWSSDVCSSDLVQIAHPCPGTLVRRLPRDSRRGADRRAPAARAPRRGRARNTEGLRDGLVRLRSEERRVGKECRSRWWTDHYKEKEKKNGRQIE